MRIIINIVFLLICLFGAYLYSLNAGLAVIVLIAALFIYLLFNLYGSIYLSSNYFIRAHTKPIDSNEKTAVLTFDDGPILQTKEILAVLAKHNCSASFFVIGDRAVGHSDVLRQIDAAGHIIGNHSYAHKPIFTIQSSGRIQEEITKTNQLIETVTGKRPRFFRPPFGAMSPFLAHALKRLRMQVIGWNIRSFDTENDCEKTLQRVKSKLQNNPNVICLLHDCTENIAELLDSIIIYLKENNYKIIPLSDALKMAPYE